MAGDNDKALTVIEEAVPNALTTFDFAKTDPLAALRKAEEVVQYMHAKCQKDPKRYLAAIKEKSTGISRDYPKVDWWTTIGLGLGLFATEERVERVKTVDPDEIRYLADVSIRHNGQVVTRASHMASNKEIVMGRDGKLKPKPWTHDEYSVRSMAVTRAVGKAFRIGFSGLAVLAGLEPTPAEEMPEESEHDEDTPSGENAKQERPVVPGEVRIGVVTEIKRGVDKSGKKFTRALVDCDGTVASGFLNRSEAHLFFAAIENADPVWDKPDPAVGHRVACTLVQSGKYVNIGAWVPWTEDIDQPLPFGNAPSAPAAASTDTPCRPSETDTPTVPPMSEAESQEREPGGDDEPDMEAELTALLAARNIMPDQIAYIPTLSGRIDYVRSRVTAQQVADLLATAQQHGLDRKDISDHLHVDVALLPSDDTSGAYADCLMWVMRQPMAKTTSHRRAKGQTTLA